MSELQTHVEFALNLLADLQGVFSEEKMIRWEKKIKRVLDIEDELVAWGQIEGCVTMLAAWDRMTR